MSQEQEKQRKETKLNRLMINKETIQDLDVLHASQIKGGGTTVLAQTRDTRCNLAVSGCQCCPAGYPTSLL